jgi:1-acyl-sn-glycerol-3-phosphate acyltransferase
MMEVTYGLARNTLVPLLGLGLRWTMEGVHRIPVRGPVILASNHVSYLDPLVLGYVADRRHRKVRFLTKAELFRKRGRAFLLRRMHQIPVERESASAAGSLEFAVDAVRGGECVAVFPEGGISLDLEPMAGQSGTARLASATGVAVTPMGLWGTHRILFKGRRPRWRWGVAEAVVVGDPLRVGPGEDVRDATDRVMAAIASCVARAREIYPQRPGPADDGWWTRPPETARLRRAQESGAA